MMYLYNCNVPTVVSFLCIPRVSDITCPHLVISSISTLILIEPMTIQQTSRDNILDENGNTVPLQG